ncbi:MAG: hypothetical protein AAFX05_14610 [Planctomycetota bacterium]
MGFESIDAGISAFMRRTGHGALRYSLAIIFLWFGILKPIGISPAEPLVLLTVDWMPIFGARTWLAIIGWWEVAIGVLFLFRPTLRFAIGLLALQMAGTFMPLVILPSVTFQEGRIPYGLTMEGQYIVKNLLIISAAMVIGGTVRTEARSSGRAEAPESTNADG